MRTTTMMSPIDAAQTIECELEFLAAYSGLNSFSTQPTFMLDLKQVDAVDPARIRVAAEGVARKWRLWAGRAEVDGAPATARRILRVPVGDLPEDYSLVNFGSSTREGCCPSQVPALSAQTCVALAGLNRELSSDYTTTQCSFDSIAAANSPLVSVLVTTFSDYQVVGFSFNHAIADAKTMGMYFRAFNAELNALEWTPPPLDTTNRTNAAFDNVRAQLKNDSAAQPEACTQPGGIMVGMKAITTGLMLKLGPRMMFEQWRHRSEQAAIFIGADVAAWLVSKIKAEVHNSTGGKEYVSSYDILTMWFLQAAYANERSPEEIHFSATCCVREILTKATGISLLNPELPLCSIWIYSQFLPSPSKTSLADLALSHRRTLLKERTLSQLLSAQTALRDSHAAGKPAPLFLATGPDALVVSNQSNTGITESIDWGHGAGKKQYAVVNLLEADDRIAFLNKIEHGWSWTCTMRPARWAAVRSQLGKLQSEFEAGEVRL